MHSDATMDPAGDDRLTIIIISTVSLVTLISMLAVCLCCRRRNPKSELAGLEGVVKLKHLDDSNLTVSIDATDSSEALNPKTKLTQRNATLPLDAKLNGFQDYELKRSSANAPHRSLPDIPIVETTCDNNSELYATVGDKLQDKPQGKSPTNPKKLANLSQHSSMSQADDVSSPYARVRSPAHAYDKLKKTEHPYAQVVQPATAGGVAQVVLENDDDDDIDDEDETTIENPISHRESSSNHDLLNTNGSAIDASAAISGRISASQELPYMTPPIVSAMQPQQHFSGDSQDSSKGYTSISVREPLANIIAQTKQQNAQRRRREIQDSHYATVSDDSDEMYAAIEDQNLYTSGSETYAQIQAPMTVSVEINATAPPPTQQPPQASTSQPSQPVSRFNRMSSSSHQVSLNEEPSAAAANVEALKNLHSRQASSSSCTSSVGNIGSPKPEKRQANSPLPPTPKGQHQSRNSTSSIMEYHEGAKIKDSNNNSSKVKQSPSKDLEGMYAKVMKKNKLSSVPSENSSPVLNRHEAPASDVTDGATEPPVKIGNEYETIDKKRNRTRNSDAGYETIPADRNNNKETADDYQTIPSSAAHYAQINEKAPKAKMSLFHEDSHELDSIDDPKYETLKLDKKVEKKGPGSNTTDSDYDPNYEMVMSKNQQKTSSSSSSTLVDDGYSQIDKKSKDVSDDESIPGYSTIRAPGERHERLPVTSISDGETESNIYSSIPTVVQTAVTPSSSNSSELNLEYDARTSTTSSVATPTTVNNNYESLKVRPQSLKKSVFRQRISSTKSVDEKSRQLTLSNSESTTLEESNYESMKYLKENPYEQLHNEKSPSGDTVSPLSEGKAPNGAAAVDDFFKV